MIQAINPCTMQQTLLVNPTKEDRKSTNAIFIIPFGLIVFSWLCIVIIIPSGSKSLQELDIQEIENQPRYTWLSLVYTIMSGFIAMIYMYILSQPIGKFIVHLGMICICLLVIFIIAALLAFIVIGIGAWASPYNVILILLSIILLLLIPYYAISYCCAFNVGVEVIFEIIRDSCRAILYNPSIVLFGCGMSVVIVLLIAFEFFLSNRIIFSENSSFTLLLLNVYGASTLTCFLANFTQIVISGFIIDWFWTRDQNSRQLNIWRNVKRISSYHLGTLAFASIPLLPHIWSIIQFFRCRDSDKDVVKRYNVYTRFFSQFCVTMNVIDFAMVQTSIYGYEFATAITAAHDLVAQNNHEMNLAVSQVATMVIGIGSSLTTMSFAFEKIHLSIYSTCVPLYIVMTTAVRTLLVNKMIINYTLEASNDDSAQDLVQRPQNNGLLTYDETQWMNTFPKRMTRQYYNHNL